MGSSTLSKYTLFKVHVRNIEDDYEALSIDCKYYAEHIKEIEDENVRLKEVLKSLMVGTHAELCGNRDKQQCVECRMRRDDVECVITDAMELLGCDMYGEHMKSEVTSE